MAKKASKSKKEDKSPKVEMHAFKFERPKPKLNEEKIKALELILKDEGLCYQMGNKDTLEAMVDAFKAGKKS